MLGTAGFGPAVLRRQAAVLLTSCLCCCPLLLCPPLSAFAYCSAAWQDLVAYRRQQEADAAALDEAVQQHMLRWRLRRMLRFWQAHVAGCAAGRQALQRMAIAAERQAVASAFTAWRTVVAQRRERLASLTALVASRQRHRAQQAAFQGWCLQVDDSYGARLQAQHAQQVLGRLRLRAVFRVSWARGGIDLREVTTVALP